MDSESVANARTMFEFMSEVGSAKHKDDILRSLDRAARQFGFDCFAISGVPSATERIDSYFMLNGWPAEWFDRYLANNYVHVDPVIRLSNMHDHAFVWSEVLRNNELDRKARRVMNEARAFGMNDGYSVPLHTMGGFQAIVTFGSEKVDLSLSARAALHVIAIYAHNSLRNLASSKSSLRGRELMRITAREREILQWCAAGKTAVEIGTILGRSYRTIQNEIFNVQRKLDVVNSAQMIAESFRFGLLR